MVYMPLKIQTLHQDWLSPGLLVLGIDLSRVVNFQSGNIKGGRGWQRTLEVELVVNASTIQMQMFSKKQNVSDVCDLDSASLQPL